jgi:toxin YoeB
MNLKLTFCDDAWEDYQELEKNSKKSVDRQLKELRRNGINANVSHKEFLSGNFAGFISTHFSAKDRIVYKITDTNVEIYQIGSHYGEH